MLSYVDVICVRLLVCVLMCALCVVVCVFLMGVLMLRACGCLLCMSYVLLRVVHVLVYVAVLKMC